MWNSPNGPIAVTVSPGFKPNTYVEPVPNQSRLDKVSYEKYGTPYFSWLILAANPLCGGLEQNIPDGAIIIIPFPLVAALQDYKSALDTHIFYYGR